ncbi:hypothetical protein [Cyclobacterium amurskyense]|uniref:Uncharacterized protein n=1 Tax=Cyclobacterium amurskyense TaxID=320787 RepID=A0A0H4PHV3_9BACT|nr:hypothetical protein [Cyclobacterium amurskyense]AKP52610.1 hypothetical protein CA2015_3213 [Cyclobacterium amurskyense]
MKEQNILNLWKAQDSKIEQILKLNTEILKEQISQRSKKALFGLKAEKITGLVFGSLYLFILGGLLAYTIKYSPFANNFFLVAIAVIFLINIKVFIDYIKHLVMASQIDFTGPVIAIQQELMELKFNLVRDMRFWYLQLPFYTLFQLGFIDFSSNIPMVWLVIQLVITFLFTLAAIWIFIHMKPKNASDKKVKWLIDMAGGKQIEKATEHLMEIKNYR